MWGRILLFLDFSRREIESLKRENSEKVFQEEKDRWGNEGREKVSFGESKAKVSSHLHSETRPVLISRGLVSNPSLRLLSVSQLILNCSSFLISSARSYLAVSCQNVVMKGEKLFFT